jgi:NAD(P)H-nitrite reductase large subunit
MRIGVVGAGHAGVEAAWRASQLGAQVVLFSGESVLPYFRPKVVALAFGQAELDGMYLRPEPWYREHGIDLRLDCAAVHLDARAKAVTAGGREERFDALVLATGATPALLAFVQEFPHDVIPLWGVRESLAIRARLGGVRHLLILGGGISGVEAALFAREAGLRVTIVEKMERVISQQLGPGAAGVLTRRLQAAGVNVVAERSANAVSKQDGHLHMTLDDGRELAGDLILTTVGATKKLTLFEQVGIKTDRGIVVDEYQQTSVPGIFACGDIAQRDGVRATTVVRAHAQGHGAGDNAVAFVQGHKPAYVPEPIAPLLFKHKDMEIQAVGPTAGAGLEEKVLTSDGETIYRSVFLQDGDPSTDAGGTLRGVQMIGSHEGFRQLLDRLGKPWQEVAA